VVGAVAAGCRPIVDGDAVAADDVAEVSVADEVVSAADELELSVVVVAADDPPATVPAPS